MLVVLGEDRGEGGVGGWGGGGWTVRRGMWEKRSSEGG